MSSEEKKAYILLKSVIFHYHGLDDDEKKILISTADELDAHQELEWASEFIDQNQDDAFARSRVFLKDIMLTLDKPQRLKYLRNVWDANLAKGYISEMEAMAMINLSKDWDVERELIISIKSMKGK
jgi:hypothetical protein